jgi:C-terminal processing protease CtpA/Prc
LALTAIALVALLSFFPQSKLSDAPRIGEVTEGSAAWVAGLRKGDLVRAIDGVAVNDSWIFWEISARLLPF